MLIKATESYCAYKASVLAAKFGITLEQARALKAGHDVETTGAVTEENEPEDSEVNHGE